MIIRVVADLMSSYDQLVDHVESGRGGLVDLAELPTWQMNLTESAGDLLQRVNKLHNVGATKAVRGGKLSGGGQGSTSYGSLYGSG